MNGNFQPQMTFATRSGLCPICRKRRRAHWKDNGAQRVTCGHPVCFHKWLPGSRNAPPDIPTAATTDEDEVRA